MTSAQHNPRDTTILSERQEEVKRRGRVSAAGLLDAGHVAGAPTLSAEAKCPCRNTLQGQQGVQKKAAVGGPTPGNPPDKL